MIEYFKTLAEQAFVIWVSGGWAMMALTINALVLFGLGMNILLNLFEKGFHSVPEKTWRHWINHSEEREGPIGELLDFAMTSLSVKEVINRFKELTMTEIVPFERDLKLMMICVSTAPLLGLLGTVTGMLATFSALASGSGGEKTMAMISKGISEALITTETGLVIALPGLFFQYQLKREHERYKAFLAHLETTCTQKIYHKFKKQQKIEV